MMFEPRHADMLVVQAHWYVVDVSILIVDISMVHKEHCV